jgi:hypothetical protein
MPISDTTNKNDVLQTFPLASVRWGDQPKYRDSQNREHKYALSGTSGDLDLAHPFNRLAHHGCLGGNHRADGRCSTVGICDDRSRTAGKPIGVWRDTDLDDSHAFPAFEPICATVALRGS